MQQNPIKTEITRFAPSPTGHLHLGHVLSLVYVFAATEHRNAKMLLRIEDHDIGRCRDEYVASIFQDVEWLGLLPENWHTIQTKGNESEYRQSHRLERYKRALKHLYNKGLTYFCRCSRTEIRARTEEKMTTEELYYDGYCRDKQYSSGVVRFRITPEPISFHDGIQGLSIHYPAQQCGDLLLRDRDENFTYHFAVVVDDIHDRIDFVVRGMDLIASTGRQIMLMQALGRHTPPEYYHHPLIYGADGIKLSKRLKSTGLALLKEAGMYPEDVLGLALHQAGVIDSIRPVDKNDLKSLIFKS